MFVNIHDKHFPLVCTILLLFNRERKSENENFSGMEDVSQYVAIVGYDPLLYGVLIIVVSVVFLLPYCLILAVSFIGQTSAIRETPFALKG